jgi:hypothetical protein
VDCGCLNRLDKAIAPGRLRIISLSVTYCFRIGCESRLSALPPDATDEHGAQYTTIPATYWCGGAPGEGTGTVSCGHQPPPMSSASASGSARSGRRAGPKSLYPDADRRPNAANTGLSNTVLYQQNR